MANLFNDLRDTAAADAGYVLIGSLAVGATLGYFASKLWEPLGTAVLCIFFGFGVIGALNTFWEDWSKGYDAGKNWIRHWSDPEEFRRKHDPFDPGR